MCDGVLFVVRAGSTDFELATKASSEFHDKNFTWGGAEPRGLKAIRTGATYGYGSQQMAKTRRRTDYARGFSSQLFVQNPN